MSLSMEVRKANDMQEKTTPEIFYHYTSLNALYGIITSKTFRMSYLRNTNDKKELSFHPDNFLENLDALSKESTGDSEKQFYNLLYDALCEHKPDLKQEYSKLNNPYALCLSKNRDSLTHWDRYGDRLQGVCIGLNVDALKSLYKKLSSEYFADALLEMGSVIYNEKGIKSYIKEQCLEYIYRSQQQSSDGRFVMTILQKSPHLLPISIYNHLLRFFKDSSFIDEDEFRVYHDTDSINLTEKVLKYMREDIDAGDENLLEALVSNVRKTIDSLELKKKGYYISNQRGICEYTNLCLKDVWSKETIPEIILGPACRQDRNTLRRFLSSNGLPGVKVLGSKVPIR